VHPYHAREGCYPASLELLAEHFDGNVPLDPFVGKPFVYLPSEDSFVLYSVGRNLVDDGGEASVYAGEGDLLWQWWQRIYGEVAWLRGPNLLRSMPIMLTP